MLKYALAVCSVSHPMLRPTGFHSIRPTSPLYPGHPPLVAEIGDGFVTQPSQRGTLVANRVEQPMRVSFAVSDGEAVDNIVRDSDGEGVGAVVMDGHPQIASGVKVVALIHFRAPGHDRVFGPALMITVVTAVDSGQTNIFELLLDHSEQRFQHPDAAVMRLAPRDDIFAHGQESPPLVSARR